MLSWVLFQRLTIGLKKDTTIVVEGPIIEVGEQSVNVTIDDGFVDMGSGAQFSLRGEFYYMEYGPLRVKWDATNVWEITLDKNLVENTQIKGLCGNYDGDPNSESLIVNYCLHGSQLLLYM